MSDNKENDCGCTTDFWCWECESDFYDYLAEAEPEHYKEKFNGLRHDDPRIMSA